MGLSATLWMDFCAAMALIAVLAMVYGALARSMMRQAYADALLGLAFGAVAFLQMNMPLEPMEGLIIDMRNVPLVVCAAFFGWRACLLCLLIAASTRYSIGGIGMWSGLLAMCVAIAVGACWARATRALPSRGMLHAAALGVVANLHLTAAFILPEAAQHWFLSNAALPIAMINLIAIPSAALLLEAERLKIRRAGRLAAAASVDPDNGTCTREAFERDIALEISAGTMAVPAAALIVKLRYFNVLRTVVPRAWHAALLGLMRARLQESLPGDARLCAVNASTMLVTLDAAQAQQGAALERRVARCMSSEPFNLSGQMNKKLTVDTRIVPWQGQMTLKQMLGQKPVKSKQGKARPPHIQRSQPVQSLGPAQRASLDALFGKAEALMQAAQGPAGHVPRSNAA